MSDDPCYRSQGARHDEDGTMRVESMPAAQDVTWIATRCPVVKDDVPEFMPDIPLTKVGDLLPEAIDCDVIDAAGQVVGRLNRANCAGRLTLLCVFDPDCCICKRFALPRLERLWSEQKSSSQCSVVALGRACNTASLSAFRDECRAAAQANDRCIVELSMPLSPDQESVAFKSLAQAMVPRFYLIGPDSSILYQFGGYEESEFDTLAYCLDQELMYL
eukprot:TRINITY_DN37500_c0_g1_i1.p1 TRINITY_DN37500_c0_g1~~TRINITY_DN37500_c0_g1_i1.p1  ORF type:complete len:218 (-),score=29.68 TRINITY_DN37500_c0_g1_i1:344-997(-)